MGINYDTSRQIAVTSDPIVSKCFLSNIKTIKVVHKLGDASLASRWGAAIDLTVGNLLRFSFVFHGKTLAISENMANQLKLFVTFSYYFLYIILFGPTPPFHSL